MATKIEQAFDLIKEMTVLELRDLNKLIEEEFGVTAAPQMAFAAGPAMMAAPGAAPAEAEEEKTAFTVTLKDIGANKINVIKAVREVTTLGLGSQGPGRVRARRRQGRRRQGRGGERQEEAGGGRRHRSHRLGAVAPLAQPRARLVSCRRWSATPVPTSRLSNAAGAPASTASCTAVICAPSAPARRARSRPSTSIAARSSLS